MPGLGQFELHNVSIPYFSIFAIIAESKYFMKVSHGNTIKTNPD